MSETTPRWQSTEIAMQFGSERSVIAVLSMSRPDLARYVDGCRVEGRVFISTDDEGEVVEVDTGSHVVLIAAFRTLPRLLEADGLAIDSDAAKIVGEMLGLLYTAHWLAETDASYLLLLDKPHFGVCGPFDSVWEILRRLALALQAEIGTVAPITFDDLLRLGGWSVRSGSIES